MRKLSFTHQKTPEPLFDTVTAPLHVSDLFKVSFDALRNSHTQWISDKEDPKICRMHL